MDAIKGTFASHCGAALLLDESPVASEGACFGVRQQDLDEYVEHWRDRERVFPAVLARGIPIHNWQMYTEDQWNSDIVWSAYGRRLRIYHYMSAPIYGSHGRLAGVLNFCRRPEDRAFDHTTLNMASALSGFLSATLARVVGKVSFLADNPMRERLAPREMEVASLAAAGRNNIEIALELGIARETVKQTLRRVYQKLDVRGRAQMATTLAARGWLER